MGLVFPHLIFPISWMFCLPFGLILFSNHSSLCVMGMTCYVCCWFYPFSCWVVTMFLFIVLIFACCWFWKSFAKWVWYFCDLLFSLVYVLMLAYGIGLLCFNVYISCGWWLLQSNLLKQLFLNVVSQPCVLVWMLWSFILKFFPMFISYVVCFMISVLNARMLSLYAYHGHGRLFHWQFCLNLSLYDFCTITILLHLSHYAP